jgi:hypothetical protein
MGIFVGAVIMIVGAVIQGASVHCKLLHTSFLLYHDCSLTSLSRHVPRLPLHHRLRSCLCERLRSHAHW